MLSTQVTLLGYFCVNENVFFQLMVCIHQYTHLSIAVNYVIRKSTNATVKIVRRLFLTQKKIINRLQMINLTILRQMSILKSENSKLNHCLILKYFIFGWFVTGISIFGFCKHLRLNIRLIRILSCLIDGYAFNTTIVSFHYIF